MNEPLQSATPHEVSNQRAELRPIDTRKRELLEGMHKVGGFPFTSQEGQYAGLDRVMDLFGDSVLSDAQAEDSDGTTRESKRGHVVLVTGLPGVGKTKKIVGEFIKPYCDVLAEEATQQGHPMRAQVFEWETYETLAGVPQDRPLTREELLLVGNTMDAAIIEALKNDPGIIAIVDRPGGTTSVSPLNMEWATRPYGRLAHQLQEQFGQSISMAAIGVIGGPNVIGQGLEGRNVALNAETFEEANREMLALGLPVFKTPDEWKSQRGATREIAEKVRYQSWGMTRFALEPTKLSPKSREELRVALPDWVFDVVTLPLPLSNEVHSMTELPPSVQHFLNKDLRGIELWSQIERNFRLVHRKSEGEQVSFQRLLVDLWKMCQDFAGYKMLAYDVGEGVPPASAPRFVSIVYNN